MCACCALSGKIVRVGNRVSHSNKKTKRLYKPNIHTISLLSDNLKMRFKLSIAVSTLRTIDHKGGFDNYLLTTSNRDLTDYARKIKKMLQKSITATKQ